MHDPKESRREMLALCGAASVAAAGSVGLTNMSFAQGPTNGRALNREGSSVKEFGAIGDGTADDTAAIQAAIDQAIQQKGGLIYLPAGKYRVTKFLHVHSSERIDIVGDGCCSILLHENDEPLLVWDEGVQCQESSVRDLCIQSVGQDKSPETPAILCRGTVRRSLFQHLLLQSGSATCGTGIEIIGSTDTICFDQCCIWDVPAGGSGIKLGDASNACEVRIFGGRFVAVPMSDGSIAKGSIGVNLMGGNGGVHIVTTDFSLFDTALKAGSEDGVLNRELFITHATFDAGRIGIHILNTAYVSIAGCWCVSNDEAQILMESKTEVLVPGGGALLTIAGGTIGNGGVFNRPGRGDGLRVEAGSFTLTGVTLWHNHGAAVRIENDKVENYVITSCRFSDNDTAALLAGKQFIFSNNVITGGREAVIDKSDGQGKIEGNILPI